MTLATPRPDGRRACWGAICDRRRAAAACDAAGSVSRNRPAQLRPLLGEEPRMRSWMSRSRRKCCPVPLQSARMDGFWQGDLLRSMLGFAESHRCPAQFLHQLSLGSGVAGTTCQVALSRRGQTGPERRPGRSWRRQTERAGCRTCGGWSYLFLRIQKVTAQSAT